MDFSFSDAKNLFGAITELYKKGSNIEAEQKLLELKAAFLELQAEYLEMKEKVGDLEQQLSLKNNVKFERNVYWIEQKDGSKDGPFCQKCFDDEGKLLRLQGGADRYRVCFKCKSAYDR